VNIVRKALSISIAFENAFVAPEIRAIKSPPAPHWRFMPELPSITDTLAWVMYKKGNYSGAIPLFENCVRKTPDSAEFHYHLGLALLAAGQKEPGKAQPQAALQMNKLGTAEKEQAQQALGQPN
jgi:tetratricopeptide (TPR) repeat protein